MNSNGNKGNGRGDFKIITGCKGNLFYKAIYCPFFLIFFFRNKGILNILKECVF